MGDDFEQAAAAQRRAQAQLDDVHAQKRAAALQPADAGKVWDANRRRVMAPTSGAAEAVPPKRQ